MESIQTVLYVDCTKYGAMCQPEINGVGEVVERVLFRNPLRGGLMVSLF